ncbi:hypothetical protein [Streptomyces radiopugnans]|uniref:hypothetical protein n=1 Tax=Streptomyces radiopugnans TaxID=403935 RepID=UPI003F1D85FA
MGPASSAATSRSRWGSSSVAAAKARSRSSLLQPPPPPPSAGGARAAQHRHVVGVGLRGRGRARGEQLRALAQPRQEPGVVAEELPLPARVGEQRVGAVDGRERVAGVEFADGVDVAAQQRRVQVGGADEVVGHHQEPAAAQPVLVPGDGLGQARLALGGRVVVEHRVEDGQEVALARAEGAVEVGGVGVAGGDGGPDDAERLVERLLQLLGDHVLGHPHVGLAEPLGQLDLEVAGVYVLLDVDDIPQEEFTRGHRRISPSFGSLAAHCPARCLSRPNLAREDQSGLPP